MNFGYRRVSTADQNTDRQLAGLTLDRVFDDHISGNTTARPALDDLIDRLRPGDTVHVHSIDRLARSVADLLAITQRITGKGATLLIHNPALTFGSDPVSGLLFHMLGAVAEFERHTIRSRAREGIERAKRAGKYRGGQPKLSDTRAQAFRALVAERGMSSACREFGISRPTGYKYVKTEK